ncbi:cytochrome C oxidase subunit IV family protein [Rhodopseudomonas telluris]|uniref:Cytochrome C oxidase subunit IV family protein n=1 Tax=Rhodopseudomonas telluris TaxID=644215 RepID=A0ABV6EMV1_9BRAD
MPALLILTGVTIALSRGPAAGFVGGALLIAIAAVKARLLVLDYFGFRNAAGPWRAILWVWIGFVALAALIPGLAQLLR